MNLHFPAVIKRIEAAESGILATFDISPPNLTALTDLIDREIVLSISSADDSSVANVTRQPPSAQAERPFEPDDSDDPPESPAAPAQTTPGSPPRRRSAPRPKSART